MPVAEQQNGRESFQELSGSAWPPPETAFLNASRAARSVSLPLPVAEQVLVLVRCSRRRKLES
jgi:hypothetical protein